MVLPKNTPPLLHSFKLSPVVVRCSLIHPALCGWHSCLWMSVSTSFSEYLKKIKQQQHTKLKAYLNFLYRNKNTQLAHLFLASKFFISTYTLAQISSTNFQIHLFNLAQAAFCIPQASFKYRWGTQTQQLHYYCTGHLRLHAQWSGTFLKLRVIELPVTQLHNSTQNGCNGRLCAFLKWKMTTKSCPGAACALY